MLVYYSLACVDGGMRERQWVQSVRSLRRHNDRVPVTLFLYGDASDRLLDEAARWSVAVRHLGPYLDCFRELPAHWGPWLAQFPTLHKFLSLRHCPTDGVDQVLYIDCDTFFFGDVEHLAARYRARHWYAREEGPLPSEFNDPNNCVFHDQLSAIVRQEGLVPVRPYNTGVCFMNGGIWGPFGALAEDFLFYAWRLVLGACLWTPEVVSNRALVDFVRSGASPGECRLALPYPSNNFWLLEEVAWWLTLGRVPHLTHDVLAWQDVVQGGEYVESQVHVLAHYYSWWEDKFFAQVAEL